MTKQATEFHFRLRGGASGSVSVSPNVAALLMGAIMNATGQVPRFVTFNAERNRVLLNVEHLISSRFFPSYRSSGIRRYQHSDPKIQVFHCDEHRPLILETNPTAPAPNKRRPMYSANYFEKVAEGDIFRFVEFNSLDRHVTLIRAADVTIVLIPLASLFAEEDAVRS
jgi:hypothetical protein